MAWWREFRKRLQTHAALADRDTIAILFITDGVSVSDPARHSGCADGAADLAVDWPGDDPKTQPVPDWSGGSGRRPANPPEQGWHSHHGRRADSSGYRDFHPAVGRPEQPLCLDCTAGHLVVRCHWLGRRLPQGGGA